MVLNNCQQEWYLVPDKLVVAGIEPMAYSSWANSAKKIKQDQDRKAMTELYKTSLTFKVFFEKLRIGKLNPNSASNLSFTDEFRPERSSSLNIFFNKQQNLRSSWRFFF